MSKQKKRKTRLKGTDTKRPCVDCGKLKDRFKDFKPRWAGCDNHRTDRGRRYFQPGCEACAEKVNGNIRQPRCIECDRSRPKKGSKKKTPEPVAVTPEPVAVTPEPEPVAVTPEPEPVAVTPEPEPVAVTPEPEPVAVTPEPEPVAVTPEPEPEPEPVVVEAKPEPSPESVSVPEPEPKRPKIATMADLSALFESDENE